MTHYPTDARVDEPQPFVDITIFLHCVLLRCEGDVESNPGPRTRVAQWNAAGTTPVNKVNLSMQLHQHSVAVCLLTETPHLQRLYCWVFFLYPSSGSNIFSPQ